MYVIDTNDAATLLAEAGGCMIYACSHTAVRVCVCERERARVYVYIIDANRIAISLAGAGGCMKICMCMYDTYI